MPYIEKSRREEIELGSEVFSAGELNYFFTKKILQYLDGDLNYHDLNEVVGVLECCKLELYRRYVAPYENKKIEQNGDVY